MRKSTNPTDTRQISSTTQMDPTPQTRPIQPAPRTLPEMEALVSWPIFDDRDFTALRNVLASGILNRGTETSSLEEEWATYLGVKEAIAVSSCSHALHLAVMAVGAGVGDEVIVPALTFCGTVNPAVHAGATPIFADVLPGTYEIDPADVARKRTDRTVAVIPVHLHGMPCDVRQLALAAPGLRIIEDACQAHGAELRGRKVGNLGSIACFSLNQVKPLGAGQGGLVVTNDPELAERVRMLASHGRNGVIGWSYGITEFSAALARTQLRRLDTNNEIGRCNAAIFGEALTDFASLLPTTPWERLPVWHKYRLLLPEGVSQSTAVTRLRSAGVECDTWPGKAVPDLDGYVDKYGAGDYPVSRRVASESVIIGSEPYPLACQSPTTVIRWAGAVHRMLSDLSV